MKKLGYVLGSLNKLTEIWHFLKSVKLIIHVPDKGSLV